MNLHNQGDLVNAVSMAADITSDAIDMESFRDGSIHLISASGARGGTIELLGSNDLDIASASWPVLTLEGGDTTIAVTAASAFNHMINLFAVGCRYIAIRFNDVASGAGTLRAIAYRKVVNR